MNIIEPCEEKDKDLIENFISKLRKRDKHGSTPDLSEIIKHCHCYLEIVDEYIKKSRPQDCEYELEPVFVDMNPVKTSKGIKRVDRVILLKKNAKTMLIGIECKVYSPKILQNDEAVEEIAEKLRDFFTSNLIKNVGCFSQSSDLLDLDNVVMVGIVYISFGNIPRSIERKEIESFQNELESELKRLMENVKCNSFQSEKIPQNKIVILVEKME